MDPRKQVTSVDLSRRLKELGVTQESLFSWYCDEERDDVDVLNLSDRMKVIGGVGYYTHQYAAFTAAEIGLWLPDRCATSPHSSVFAVLAQHKNTEGTWFISYSYQGIVREEMLHFTDSVNEAEARGWMLVYLLEKEFITLP